MKKYNGEFPFSYLKEKSWFDAFIAELYWKRNIRKKIREAVEGRQKLIDKRCLAYTGTQEEWVKENQEILDNY